jgi:hypothetical protein
VVAAPAFRGRGTNVPWSRHHRSVVAAPTFHGRSTTVPWSQLLQQLQMYLPFNFCCKWSVVFGVRVTVRSPSSCLCCFDLARETNFSTAFRVAVLESESIQRSAPSNNSRFGINSCRAHGRHIVRVLPRMALTRGHMLQLLHRNTLCSAVANLINACVCTNVTGSCAHLKLCKTLNV